MRALLTATAMLLVAMPAVAQSKKLHIVNTVNGSRVAASATPNLQAQVGVPQWTFAVAEIQHRSGWASATHLPYGVFASKDQCEMARAKVVANLDNAASRQWKPTEFMYVSECDDRVKS